MSSSTKRDLKDKTDSNSTDSKGEENMPFNTKLLAKQICKYVKKEIKKTCKCRRKPKHYCSSSTDSRDLVVLKLN